MLKIPRQESKVIHVPDNTLFSAAHVAEARRAEAWLADRIAASNKLPPDELITEVVTITPALAELILSKHNDGNRPLKTARFEYARAMTDGRWKTTSQGISFSRDGRLNNGQNRLTAVIIAARPVKMNVAFGEDRDVFDVLDTGAKRVGSDALAIAGHVNHAVLAAALRTFWNIERGTGLSDDGVTNDVLLSVLKDHPGIEAHVTSGASVGKKLRSSTGALTAAFYLISRNSRQSGKLPDFIGRLSTGVGTKPGDAVITLRDALMKHAFGQRPSRTAWATIAAWNRFLMKNGTAQLSKLMPDANKPFPRPE